MGARLRVGAAGVAASAARTESSVPRRCSSRSSTARVDVAGERRVAQRRVLGGRAATAPKLLRAEQHVALRVLGEHADDAPRPRRGAAREQRGVEVQMRFGAFLERARRFEPVERVGDLAAVRVVAPAQRLAQRRRLEAQAQRVEIGGVLERELGDAHAALRAHLDQPRAAQSLERLAQRRRAHLPALGQLLGAQLRPGRKLAGQDRGAQPAQGPVAAGLGGGFGHAGWIARSHHRINSL